MTLAVATAARNRTSLDAKATGYRLLRAGCRAIPRGLAPPLLFLISRAYHLLDAKGRQRVRNNLRVLSEYSGREFTPLSSEVYRHFACFLYELFSFAPDRSPCRDEEAMADVFRRTLGPPGGGPALIVSGHLGNWECFLRVLARTGYKAATVALHHGSPAVDALYASLRYHPNLEVYPLQDGLQRGLKALAEGRILTLACERDYTGGGIPVRVAGRSVRVPAGPAYLHLRTGAPIFCGGGRRIKLGLFDFKLEPLDTGPHTNRQDALPAITQLIVDRIFGSVLREPAQWLTFDDYFAAGSPS